MNSNQIELEVSITVNRNVFYSFEQCKYRQGELMSESKKQTNKYWPEWQEHREVLKSWAESCCYVDAVYPLLFFCCLPQSVEPPFLPGHLGTQKIPPHYHSTSPRISQGKPPLWKWTHGLFLCHHPAPCGNHLWLFSSQCSSLASV